MQMMRGKCGKCHWEFDVAALPGPVLDVTSAMRLRSVCPLCYSTQVFVASPRPLTADEIAAKGLGPLGTASSETAAEPGQAP